MKIKRKTKKLIKELKNMESGIFKFSDGKYIYQSLDEYLGTLYNEINRLNFIIDELEKTINECSILGEYGTSRMFIEKDYLLNKLKELKEEGK